MTTLRDFAIKTILSLVFLCSFLHTIQTEYHTTKYTTTTTTKQPIIRSPGLSLPQRHSNPPKCTKEVPAIFFQYERDVQVIGNSSLNPHFNLIEVCCQGYKRYDFDWTKCVPDCGQKCQRNGFCLEGGVCQCFEDFVLNHRNDCVPTCPLGCPNGECYLNGTCVCNKGYQLDATKKYCEPNCTLGCGRNEVCDAPDTCVCAEGYAKALHSPNAAQMGCQPVCIPDCGFGHCVGPNQCECFPGYQQRVNSSICESNCYLRCENGFCANRTGCICQDGYKYDVNTTSCLPDCGDDCENGICTAPGFCRCFNGYQRNGSKCEAICEHGCGFYGKCIAPGVCGCAIVDGPFKSYQKCELGFCNSKGRCRCQVGTTRFINQCLVPDKVTTYASMKHQKLNEALIEEFNLLIGRHFTLGDFTPFVGYFKKK
ncbi:von Willebrand factor D and EGF domain-containing protein [Lucilia sericata]|uniref:von Willebrand factor D and EGF domain-containing protein n=1 Tax=Lucilia sericata TaxID=13632 RepID=UPI0018A85BA0|nr:von Willebrand factor D and EGF domain-containing protein [Lucilia sericata]